MQIKEMSATCRCRRCGFEQTVEGRSRKDCSDKFESEGWVGDFCPGCCRECDAVWVVFEGYKVHGVFRTRTLAEEYTQKCLKWLKIEQHVVMDGRKGR